MSLSIRAYRASHDADAVYDLWQAALGPVWPVTPDLLKGVLTEHPAYHEGDHFVAERHGRMVGFAATQVYRGAPAPEPRGGIAAIVVDPQARRRGIGAALHAAAVEHLRQTGMRRAQLAGGAAARFWPGVPVNLPEAIAFFRACGWEFTETSHDLVRHLRDYATPAGIYQRVAGEPIAIQVATAEDVPEVLAFEAREFPSWSDGFRGIAGAGDHADLLVARDARRAIVGTLEMFGPQPHSVSASFVWKRLLGDDMGGLGAVGVAPEARERGIGTAMVARASEILRERGVGQSHVGWTWLLDFYGRLGYRPWREYQMSWRNLPA
jgi:GNAT superfamily N-acetyltransferase